MSLPPKHPVSQVDALPLTAPRKPSAERPNKLSIFFSVAAIIISLCSAGYSRQAYNLAEATSRAVVEPTSLAITAPWKWGAAPGAAQDPIKLEMTVLNSGKLLATSLQIQLWASLINAIPQIDIGSGDYPTGRFYGKVGPALSEDDIGPGMQRTFKIGFDVNPEPGQKIDLSSLGQVNTIRFQPNFYYADASGARHEQPCFQAYAAANGTFAAGPVYPCNMFDRRPVAKP